MKKQLPVIAILISVVSCLFTILCLVRITELKLQLQRFDNQWSNRLYSLTSTIEHLPYTLNSIQEQQNSRFSSTEYKYGEVDEKNHTVDLNCAITLKEYQPETTKVAIVVGARSYPMTLKQGTYRATLPLSLFHQVRDWKAVISEGEMEQTEDLGWCITPRYDLLPQVRAYYSGSYKGKSEIEVNGEFNVHVSLASGEESTVELSLVEAKNNEIVKRTLLESQVSSLYDSQKSYPIDGVYEIGADSSYEWYVEAVDNYGFCYRYYSLVIKTDQNGNQINEELYSSAEIASWNVYDQEGTLLFDAYNEQ